MKKICITAMLCIALVGIGCNGKKNVSEITEVDVELDKPEVTVVDNSHTADSAGTDNSAVKTATGSDYGDKKVVDGFWINEEKSNGEVIYRYIPLMNPKTAGIFDIEDSENNEASSRLYSGYNAPKGTRTASLKTYSCALSYYDNAKLGYNSSEEAFTTQEKRVVASFSLLSEDGVDNTLCSYDVGCITFALYKNIYPDYPDMKLQVYGVPDDVIMQNVGDVAKCDTRKYYNFLTKDCVNNGFAGCVLLGEKEITDSGIFYIDYKKMSEENNCTQFLLVLNVSETSGFAYFMNGNNCYNIADEEQYQLWKKQHIEQYIGE